MRKEREFLYMRTYLLRYFIQLDFALDEISERSLNERLEYIYIYITSGSIKKISKLQNSTLDRHHS